MLFPTITFAIFFAVVLAGHLRLRTDPQRWKPFMLASSYLFYGWWDWRFVSLLVGSTVFNWAMGRLLDRFQHRFLRWTVLFVAVVTNLAVLGLFKYYHFLLEAVTSGFGSQPGLPLLDLILPIGISFYTFQALSYVVDLYRKDLESRSLVDVAVYLAFFPQLVAGPIVRATEFLPQLDDISKRSEFEASEAAWLIGRGLMKKVVVAGYLAETVVDPVFAAPSTATGTELLMAFYGYAIQIYADFSGYTDIAIGVALLLGFRFPQNFNNPYRALSVQDFWRRWHMTLSRWLRDYLYIPLSGNRRNRAVTYLNVMATMLLGGLWHGAAWNFVAWGSLHGFALVIGRVVRRRRSLRSLGEFGSAKRPGLNKPEPWPTPVKWLATFHLVAVAWIPFRADGFGIAWDFFTSLITTPPIDRPDLVAVALILGALAAQIMPSNIGQWLFTQYARITPTVQSATIGAWVFLVASLGPEGVAPFIYFQF